jgi:hypothetical protein
MSTYEITYRVLNSHRMIDLIEATDEGAALRTIKSYPIMVTIESIRTVTADWAIERDRKMFFCVTRVIGAERDFVRSASGKVSSFKTYAAARRALKWANARADESTNA